MSDPIGVLIELSRVTERQENVRREKSDRDDGPDHERRKVPPLHGFILFVTSVSSRISNKENNGLFGKGSAEFASAIFVPHVECRLGRAIVIQAMARK
jgi:hypothetical protein